MLSLPSLLSSTPSSPFSLISALGRKMASQSCHSSVSSPRLWWMRDRRARHSDDATIDSFFIRLQDMWLVDHLSIQLVPVGSETPFVFKSLPHWVQSSMKKQGRTLEDREKERRSKRSLDSETTIKSKVYSDFLDSIPHLVIMFLILRFPARYITYNRYVLVLAQNKLSNHMIIRSLWITISIYVLINILLRSFLWFHD